MSYYSYLEELFEEMKSKKDLEPHKSYTAYLSSLSSESVSKKFMEEAFELSLANVEMIDGKGRDELIGEASDVIYHLMALLVSKDVDFKEILEKLESRGGVKKIDKINFKKG